MNKIKIKALPWVGISLLLSGCNNFQLDTKTKDTIDPDLQTKSLHEIRKMNGRFVSYSEYLKIKETQNRKKRAVAKKSYKKPTMHTTPKKVVINHPNVKPKKINTKKVAVLADMTLKQLLNKAYRKKDHSKKMAQAIIAKLPMEYAKIDVDMAIEDITNGITQSKLKELKQALNY